METELPNSPNTAGLCGIVTPVGMLGYGMDEADMQRGIELCLSKGLPTAIILDSGSTDSGPEKLATGCMTMPQHAYLRDMKKLIRAVLTYGVPLVISSAGGDGSDAHVREILDLTSEALAYVSSE